MLMRMACAGTEAAAQAGQGLADKLAALGEPLLVVAIVVGALVLLFSARLGKQILVYAAIAGFLLLGGWRWIVEFIKYLLD